MDAEILDQDGRIVTVKFTFDDGTTWQKKMDLQPNDQGDPFDDLAAFFKKIADNYKQNKQAEVTNSVPNVDSQTFNLD